MSLQSIALVISASILTTTILFAFIRFLMGPSLPDRIVALDLMATVSIGVIAVYSMAMDQPVFLDVALILGLVSFLGTVAFAFYLGGRKEPPEGE